MKKFTLLFVILFSIIYYSNAQMPVGEDWKLSEADANGMLSRLKQCGLFKPCHDNSNVKNPNNDEYNWIVATYGATSKISKIEARYRPEDEDRYKRMRGITDSQKAKVRGYKTLIVQVEPNLSKGAMAETAYYDCFSICPPPDNCD